MLLLPATGRLTRKACENRYGTCGESVPVSSTVTVRDTTVITDVDTVIARFPYPLWKTDTLSRGFVVWDRPKIRRVGNVTISWANDSLLTVTALCPRDTVRIKGVDKTTTLTQWKTRTVETRGWNWVSFAIGAIAVMILVVAILLIK